MALPTVSKPARVPLEIEIGVTWDPYIEWADADGYGYDLTGVDSIEMTVRASVGAAAALLELTTADGSIINAAAVSILGAVANNVLQVATVSTAGVVTVDAVDLADLDFVSAGVQANDILYFSGTDSNDGDGFGHYVLSVDSATQVTVNPISLANPSTGFALVAETSGNGTLSVSRNGRFQLVQTAAETALIDGVWSIGVYDIRITDSGGNPVIRPMKGTIKASRGITT